MNQIIGCEDFLKKMVNFAPNDLDNQQKQLDYNNRIRGLYKNYKDFIGFVYQVIDDVFYRGCVSSIFFNKKLDVKVVEESMFAEFSKQVFSLIKDCNSIIIYVAEDDDEEKSSHNNLIFFYRSPIHKKLFYTCLYDPNGKKYVSNGAYAIYAQTVYNLQEWLGKDGWKFINFEYNVSQEEGLQTQAIKSGHDTTEGTCILWSYIWLACVLHQLKTVGSVGFLDSTDPSKMAKYVSSVDSAVEKIFLNTEKNILDSDFFKKHGSKLMIGFMTSITKLKKDEFLKEQFLRHQRGY